MSILGADVHHFLTLADVGFLRRIAVELDIALDKFHCTVCASGHGLH